MSGYTKLFSSIVTSTVWQEPNHIRIAWVTLMALSDQDGIVEGSIPGLASIAHITISEFEEALKVFKSPDPYSRTKEHDGRRILEIDGGFQLINHRKFREKMNFEDRREYKRRKAQEYRQKNKSLKTNENLESDNDDRRQNVHEMSTVSTNGQNGHIQNQNQNQNQLNKDCIIENTKAKPKKNVGEVVSKIEAAQAPKFLALYIAMKDPEFSYLADQGFKQLFCGFLEMRKKLRKPPTEMAQKTILKKLHDYQLAEAKAMLEMSIERSWLTVYPRNSSEQFNRGNNANNQPATRKYDSVGE